MAEAEVADIKWPINATKSHYMSDLHWIAIAVACIASLHSLSH